MINMTAETGEQVSKYTGNVRPALVITLVIIVVHIALMVALVDEINIQFLVFNGLLFILYMLFCGVMVFQATRFTITVYEKGIGWQRGGSYVFTSWNNIAAIGRKNEGDSATFGIYLHEQVMPVGATWPGGRLFSAPVDYIRLTPTVNVPTIFKGLDGNVIDMPALAETDFGQDVLRYAPHVFEQAE